MATRRPLVIACLGAMFMTAVASAQTNAPTTLPQQQSVEALLAKLSSEDFKTRQAASDELIALGPAAMPAIKQAAEAATDKEVAARLRSAWDALEEQRVLLGNLITLDLKDVPVKDALEQIAAKAGESIQINGDSLDKKISLHLVRTSFFLALAQLNKQVPFRFDFQFGRSSIEVGRPGLFLTSDSGAIVLSGGHISYTATSDLSSAAAPPAHSRELTLHFDYRKDARLRLRHSARPDQR